MPGSRWKSVFCSRASYSHYETARVFMTRCNGGTVGLGLSDHTTRRWGIICSPNQAFGDPRFFHSQATIIIKASLFIVGSANLQ
jgi:hypothetical protein